MALAFNIFVRKIDRDQDTEPSGVPQEIRVLTKVTKHWLTVSNEKKELNIAEVQGNLKTDSNRFIFRYMQTLSQA